MRSTKQRAARPLALLVAPLALMTAAVASGCSTAQHDAGDLREQGTASAARRDTDRVVEVRLLVTGGIAGVHEAFRVTRAEAPAGVSTAEAGRVLALAGRLAESFRGEPSRMAGACCDRLIYDVTVRRADGSRVRVRFGGAKTPPAPLVRMAELLAPAG